MSRSCKNFYYKIYEVELNKNEIFDKLKNNFDGIIITSENQNDVNPTHHIAIQMLNPIKPEKVLKILHKAYNKTNISRMLSKHLTNIIKLITSFDHEPCYSNFSFDQFSFGCRAVNWARKTIEFKLDDEFVSNHPSQLKYLKDLHYSTHNISRELINIKPKQIQKFNNWRDEVIDWFNDWALTGYSHKKK